MLDTLPTPTLYPRPRLHSPGTMTETTTTQPTDDPPTYPGDILLSLIVALLAPMFLTASGSDINLARLAAFETVNAYRARSQADLITIAQIVGCGLAALGSLGLSMADDLSVSMVLRLRGNAVALNRSIDQNRRALAASQAAKPITPPDPVYEAKVQANVTAAQKLTAEAMATLRKPEPRPAAIAPQAAPGPTRTAPGPRRATSRPAQPAPAAIETPQPPTPQSPSASGKSCWQARCPMSLRNAPPTPPTSPPRTVRSPPAVPRCSAAPPPT